MAFLFAIAMASFIASDITMPPDSEKKKTRARPYLRHKSVVLGKVRCKLVP